jgi:nicotinamidase/pyrazinamidase
MKTKPRVALMIIDPQNDFCNQDGALFVPGAYEDSLRMANFIHRFMDEISNIYITLDSHSIVHIAHPIFWVDKNGEQPSLFTRISLEDLDNGVWRTANPEYQNRAREYVKQLEINGKYLLVIWPPHCILGSLGHNVVEPIHKAVVEWQMLKKKNVNIILKGMNMWTENYSAVKADVPDPDDVSTHLNIGLIKTIECADIILFGGQTLSHCVANTIEDIANNFEPENIKKMVLLRDTTSSVTGFEDLGENFIERLTARGMAVEKSFDFSLLS